MDARLRSKVALITGAASGIGRAIALALASEGVDISVVDDRPSDGLIHELQQRGVSGLSVEADVSREQDVVAAVGATVSRFGRIDLFVSNAAAAWHEPFTAITTEAWYKTINTNLSACVWGCREVSKHMISRQSGSILIVGSVAGIHPSYGQASYSTSKLALRSLFQTLAIEMAPHGIRVNSLVPGHHPTGMTAGVPHEDAERIRMEIPLRRFGDVDACGHSAVFLLSDALSPYTTGAELVVDGGLHLRPLRVRPDAELAAMNSTDQ